MISRRFSLPALAATGSLLLGLAISYLEVKWLAAGIVGFVAIGFVISDYRIGVVCLTMLLPWSYSPLLPQTSGFNLVNFLVLASIGSLWLRRGFSQGGIIGLPRIVFWCYLAPITLGTVIAWPHLREGVANFPSTIVGEASMYSPANYLKSHIVKPLFFVVYALLLANAVRDSKRPERFLVSFGLSAVLPAIVVSVAAIYGATSVDRRDTFLEGFGMGPNAFGWLLALATGPLLFMALGHGERRTKIACGIAFTIVSTGLLLTGSRGAAVAYGVVLICCLLHRKKVSDLARLLVLAGLLAAAVPEKTWERLTLGLDDAQATSVHNMDDPLTKGRIASWAILSPEILNSPVWGEGIGSVAWNSATSAGKYGATVSHNAYLDVLLDLGIVGLLAFAYLYYRYARGMKTLASHPQISKEMQDYFRGAHASLLGSLAMAVTNGLYMPHPEQLFWWFSLGMLFGNWNLTAERKSLAAIGSQENSVERNVAAEFSRTRWNNLR